MHIVSYDPLKSLWQLPQNTVLLARVPKGRPANTQTPLQDLQGLFRITKRTDVQACNIFSGR
jgi:hypothetical protein